MELGGARMEWILLGTYWVVSIELRTIHEHSVGALVQFRDLAREPGHVLQLCGKHSAGSEMLAHRSCVTLGNICQIAKSPSKQKTGLAFFLCPNALRRIQRQDCSLKFQRLDELIELCFATLKVHKDLHL